VEVEDLGLVRLDGAAQELPLAVAGADDVTHVGPALFYLQPQAVPALSALAHGGARLLNPVGATLVTDDKAATALVLEQAGISQLPTVACAPNLAAVTAAAERIGYPVVVKRAHGAQGKWVARARSADALPPILADFATEGADVLLVQRLVDEFSGNSVRVIVTGGDVTVSALRQAPPGEWRSNINRGGSQRAIPLTAEERGMCTSAAAALGLGLAGVDLLRTRDGPIVLEVNSCPDFTSIIPYTSTDLARTVIDAIVGLP